jgi:hypothetical protein
MIDCATMGVPLVEAADWALFPNPATERVKLEFDDNAAAHVLQIFNAAGELVWGGDSSAKEVEIDVSTWPSGMYIVAYMSDQRRHSQRFVKE